MSLGLNELCVTGAPCKTMLIILTWWSMNVHRHYAAATSLFTMNVLLAGLLSPLEECILY